jgi:hypothetical protein
VRFAAVMVVLAFITDPHVVKRILDHLHLPSVPPPVAPARTRIRGAAPSATSIGACASSRRTPGTDREALGHQNRSS